VPLPFGEVCNVLYAQGIFLLYGKQPEMNMFKCILSKTINSSAVGTENLRQILRYILCKLKKPARIWQSQNIDKLKLLL
jgi:hypothetical protein